MNRIIYLFLFCISAFFCQAEEGEYNGLRGAAEPIEGNELFCVNTPQTFNVLVNKGTGADELSHTEWDFGDGSAIITDSNLNTTQSHSHTYEKKGVYTITVKAFRKSDNTEIISQRQRLIIKVATCSLPVNHNISTMEY